MNKYTIREFAMKSNLTIRTIRFYEKLGLLKTNLDNRNKKYLTDSDFLTLNMIILLKSAKLPLSSIKKILEENTYKEQLQIQKGILENQIIENEAMIELINNLSIEKEMNAETVFALYNHLIDKNKYNHQFKTTDGLNTRIQFHQLYNKEKKDWFEYLFDGYQFKENSEILEIGAGTGNLWQTQAHRIPKDVSIIITDNQEGMIEEAKENLKKLSQIKEYKVMDANKIDYPNQTFDIVIVNHVFMFIDDLKTTLTEIKRVLKEDGVLYCSGISEINLIEIEDLFMKYIHTNMKTRQKLIDNFTLENGEEKLKTHFNTIKKVERSSYYLIDDATILADYILSSTPLRSLPKDYSDNREDLIDYIQTIMNQSNGIIKATTKSGYFIAYNQ